MDERRTYSKLRRLAVGGVLLGLTACSIGKLIDALDGPFYHVSAGNGVYLTIKRHATGCMVYAFNNCKKSGKSDDTCGREVLRLSREIIGRGLSGRAKDIWNGDYSIAGYHPRLKNGFEDDEAGDFAQAVHDLASRTDECLRLHWKPTGENWTTLDDEGYAECSFGDMLTIPNTTIRCGEGGLR